MEVDWPGQRLNDESRGLVDYTVPSYNYRPQWHPWFSTWTRDRRRRRSTESLDKSTPSIQGEIVNSILQQEFDSGVRGAPLIRLQFVAIAGFVGIQSSSLRTPRIRIPDSPDFPYSLFHQSFHFSLAAARELSQSRVILSSRNEIYFHLFEFEFEFECKDDLRVCREYA